MRTATNLIARLVVGGMLLLLARPTNAVELATGLLWSNGKNDPIHCCLANVDDPVVTLFDLVLYDKDWAVHSLNYDGKAPVDVPGQKGVCINYFVNPGFYRCKWVVLNTTAEHVRATLAIVDDHGGILGELEGHPLPDRPPCGQATAPQCNGTCPPGEGSCRPAPSFNGCICVFR